MIVQSQIPESDEGDRRRHETLSKMRFTTAREILNGFRSRHRILIKQWRMVDIDWPIFQSIASNVAEYIGEVTIGEEADRLLIDAALCAAYEQYERDKACDDDVRLARLATRFFGVLEAHLVITSVTAANGRRWLPEDGTPLLDWLRENGDARQAKRPPSETTAVMAAIKRHAVPPAYQKIMAVAVPLS